MNPKRLLFIGGLLLALAVGLSASSAAAQEGDPVPAPQGVDNSACLGCHASPGLQTELPSGEVLYVSLDEETYYQSVHGQLEYACVQCHTDKGEYPHDPITSETRREYTLEHYQACIQCHDSMYNATLDSVHQTALAAGNENAAVCTDCHGAHDITDPHEPRTRIPQTCERCHSEIYSRYEESVHGSALIGDGNPDVPTCVDCHGVHDVEGPSAGSFHLFSPQICADCHADEELMAQYDISTNVFDTYISDFHGTTVLLFEEVAPDQETNKPVCIDCHGVHDMRMVDDPESRVMKENLLATCQRCHPDASANFPSSWLSHYEPNPETTPAVFYVNLFYKILIPGTIGGMLVFVTSDAYRRITSRRKERTDE
jgi:hypothetical protein